LRGNTSRIPRQRIHISDIAKEVIAFGLLWIIIIVILVLAILGFFGRGRF